MSFYVYQLIKPLTLPNTSTSLSAISHQSSAISYQSSAISYQLSVSLSTIHYFYRTEPKFLKNLISEKVWSNCITLSKCILMFFHFYL